MIYWYSLSPLDTIFCKSAGPMVMGENHSAQSIFPPPAETLSGAFRTAVLKQNNIEIKDYLNNKAGAEITDFIGKAGGNPNFEIAGILFVKDFQIYVPAPFSWFAEKSELGKNKSDLENGRDKAVRIFRAEKMSTPLVKVSTGTSFYCAKGDIGELTSLGGKWLSYEDLAAQKKALDIYSSNYFYDPEIRTGIALSGKNRTVRESHLYSFTHSRLKNGFKMAAAVKYNGTPLLKDRGIIKTGGEQRISRYEKMETHLEFDDSSPGKFMSLCPLKIKTDIEDKLISTGRILYTGGWDLKKGFHKPMRPFYPAGTVFSENINNTLIKIEENV